MRPLPDLTDLVQSPSIFNQPTDDFNLAFASEFANSDAQQGALDAGTPGVYLAMDPLSSAIDALGNLINLGGAVLDLLSGDLNLVNLDPEILNFQALDAALDSNLQNPLFDFTAAADSLINSIVSAFLPVLTGLQNEIFNLEDQVFFTITNQQNIIDMIASGITGGVL